MVISIRTEHSKRSICQVNHTIFIEWNITVGMWSENIVDDTRIWSKLAFSAQTAW